MLCSLAQAELRTWTLKNGKTKEAEYVLIMSDTVILKTKRGRQLKLPINQLSLEDLDWLVLANPPKLKIQIKKRQTSIKFGWMPNLGSNNSPPKDSFFARGVTVTKESSKPYPNELKIELFSFADEIDGKNFVLLDRVSTNITLSAENEYSCTLWTKKARLNDENDWFSQQRRGEKPKGQMVIITDERGVIIDSNISNKWMLDILEELREFPVGKHFNKAGERVWPPQPDIPQDWGVMDQWFD